MCSQFSIILSSGVAIDDATKMIARQTENKKLKKMLEKAAEDIHANNVKRVIRALEFYEQTGTRISEHNEAQKKKESPYNYLYLVLNDDRAAIYDRIDRRIDLMLDQGLVEEVKQLKQSGCTRDLVSMQGLGYKEILSYLEGELSFEDAVYILKRDTRHFAKRQLTWFKRERDVIWLNKQDYSDSDDMLQSVLSLLQEHGIILTSERKA